MLRQRLSSNSDYLVVQRSVPGYRTEFFRLLNNALDGRLVVASGDARDPLGHVGVRWEHAPLIERRAVIQYIPLALWKSSAVVVFELNPRAMSTWVYLLLTKIRGRRSVLWGHRESRRGTRPRIRRWIDRLSDATVYYTVTEAKREAHCASGGRPIYTAPNTLRVEYHENDVERRDVVLSARLVEDKDPLLAVRAIASSGLSNIVLHIVGDGPLREAVAAEAQRQSVEVVFHGAVYDPVKLAQVYQNAFVAVSPGYVGLNLNQAVLSGVPLVYRADALHAPEVSYADEHNSVAVEGVDPEVWGRVLAEIRKGTRSEILPPDQLAAISQRHLGLPAMVAGMRTAITSA